MREAAASVSTLPNTPDGLPAPTIRLSGDVLDDLKQFGRVDTYYLDDLYTKMNETGLYKGNNEVFRSLHNFVNSAKQAHEAGTPKDVAKVEAHFDELDQQFTAVGEALSELGHYKLADFYVRFGTSINENARLYVRRLASSK